MSYRTEPRTLAQLHRRMTCYEVVASLPDGEVIRLGFTARPYKRALLDMARSRADTILPYLSDDDAVSYTASEGLQLGPVRIHKSGFTERECSIEEGGS